MVKNKLLKFKLLPNLDMLLAKELYRYCIENKITIGEVLEDSICKYIKVDKVKLKKQEDEYVEKVNKDYNFWLKLLEEYRVLEDKYKSFQKKVKERESAIRKKYQKLAEEEITRMRKERL